MKIKKIETLESLIAEIQDIRKDLPTSSPEQIRDIVWHEAKFDRKEDHCISYILRLGKIQLLDIVTSCLS